MDIFIVGIEFSGGSFSSAGVFTGSAQLLAVQASDENKAKENATAYEQLHPSSVIIFDQEKFQKTSLMIINSYKNSGEKIKLL